MAISNSKAGRMEDLIRRAVRAAIYETAFVRDDTRDVLRKVENDLVVRASSFIADDAYRMKEIDDIIRWKKKRRE